MEVNKMERFHSAGSHIKLNKLRKRQVETMETSLSASRTHLVVNLGEISDADASLQVRGFFFVS